MPTFRRHREHKTDHCYDLCFDYKDNKGWGLAFPCSPDGKVNLDQLTPSAIKNLAHGLCHPELFDRYVQHYLHAYTEPAVIQCEHCGEPVTLDHDDGMGIECDTCDAIYNLSGERLAPRSNWDEYLSPDDCHMVSEYYGGYDG